MRVSKNFATVSALVIVACTQPAEEAAEPSAPQASLPPQPESEQTYSPPRTSFGHPNLQGIWQVANTAEWNIEDHAASLGVPAGQAVVVGGTLPYRPEALARREANYENRLAEDPGVQCRMVGVPRITYMPFPFRIVQTPEKVTILYEYIHTIRNVYLDSEHPGEFDQPLWMGDSRGRWDGDTLVVDSVNFTDQTWFDRSGNYHSEALHVVERYTPTSANHILYEVTIEDPGVYSESWQMRMPIYRRIEENARLLEYECHDYLESSR
ncbi:MAG TPA: hypothetical protein VIV14_11065 [Gammaproteobacteria bacterium]